MYFIQFLALLPFQCTKCSNETLNIYQGVRIFQVVCPVRANIPLSPDVPHVEAKARVSLDRFDVEAPRGGRLQVFVRLVCEHFEERRLPRVVQTQEEDPVLRHARVGARVHGQFPEEREQPLKRDGQISMRTDKIEDKS